MKKALRALIVLTLFTFSSAYSQGEINGQNVKQINSREDIAQINEYVSKKDKTLTDDDGFPLRYEVEYIWERGKILTTSDTINGESSNRYVLKLMIGLCKINLSLNGEPQATFQVIGQIYSLLELTSRTTFREKVQYLYYPELDDKAVRDNIIKKLTNSPLYREYFDFDQKGINEIVKAIKKSNIFNYSSAGDFYN